MEWRTLHLHRSTKERGAMQVGFGQLLS